MPQNTPKDERWLLRRLAALERRVASLETSPRAGNTSLSGGKLTVGAPDSPDRIEVDAGLSRIRFYSPDGPGDVYSPGGSAGVQMQASTAAGDVFPGFGTHTLIWNGGYFSAIQINRVDGATNTVQAQVYADVQDSGGGNSRGSVSISARGDADHDGSVVDIFADGGVIVSTNSRTTDPPTPPADSIVLYVKGGRLYYRDPTGTVRGPL